MSKYKVPDLLTYNDIRPFVLDFLEINSSKIKLSQRNLSQKLKWPSSYLPALLNGKKSFSIARAIQLSKYLKLGPVDTERLIYFAIIDSKLASKEDLQSILKSKSDSRIVRESNLEFMEAKTILIFEIIHWKAGEITFKKLVRLAALKGISDTETRSIYSHLLKKKMIENKKSKISTLVSNIHTDENFFRDENKICRFHQDLCDMQKAYFQVQPLEGPATFNSGILCLHKKQAQEIGDRLIAFRNWIFEVSESATRTTDRENTQLFQFSMNVTPVFSKASLKK